MRKTNKLEGNALSKAIKEAQKDPQFVKEIQEFIRASTSVYKLQ